MSQNNFAVLFPEDREVDQPEAREAPAGKARDSKRREPYKPNHGREYDHNSVKGERTRPPKQGYGRGNEGNPKDPRVREETAEQKARREEREADIKVEMEKHEAYVESIKAFEGVEVIGEAKIEVQKNHEVPAEIMTLAKPTEKAEKKNRKAKFTEVNL